LTATALLVAVPLTGAHQYTVQRDPTAGVERTAQNYPGAAVLRGDVTEAPDVPIIPTGAEREHEWGDTGGACPPEDTPESLEGLGHCRVIAPDDGAAPARTVVVIGDSHAQQLLTPIHRAADAQGWTVISYLRMACRYAGGAQPADAECGEFNAAAGEAALAADPDAVVTIGTRSLPEAPHEMLVDGYEDGVRPFLDAGIPVLGFRDNPRFPFSMFACVETYGPDHHRCNPPRSESLLPENPLEEVAARHEDLHSIDLTDRLCTDTVCPGVIGNIQVYMDLDHVTSTYGETLAPDVESRMLEALNWPDRR
ncbi:SGNH hydrolase domain-containing protein, partial [Kocuria oceani]